MKIRLMLITAILLIALLLTPMQMLAQTEEGECSVNYLFNAWARPTPEGAPNGAVFGLLVNLSAEQDTLVSATTQAAEAVEFHETTMGDGDVMQMRPVEGGFGIEPNNYIELKPGGYHMMLINLSAPLEEGSSIDVVLNFENAGEVTVTVPVVEMAAEGAMEMGSEMQMQPEATPEALPSATVDWGEACAGVHFVGGWARPAAAGMPNSAAYGLLLNLTDTEDTFVSADTEVAEAAELHEMSMGDGDVMQMRQIEGGIVVPAGGAVLLQPGGLHIMLIGLNQELAEGTTVDLTLTFAESDAFIVTVPIQQPVSDEMQMG